MFRPISSATDSTEEIELNWTELNWILYQCGRLRYSRSLSELHVPLAGQPRSPQSKDLCLPPMPQQPVGITQSINDLMGYYGIWWDMMGWWDMRWVDAMSGMSTCLASNCLQSTRRIELVDDVIQSTCQEGSCVDVWDFRVLAFPAVFAAIAPVLKMKICGNPFLNHAVIKYSL